MQLLNKDTYTSETYTMYKTEHAFSGDNIVYEINVTCKL